MGSVFLGRLFLLWVAVLGSELKTFSIVDLPLSIISIGLGSVGPVKDMARVPCPFVSRDLS